MTGFFKKVASGAKKLFGKVKGGLSDTFKKGGYLQQGISAVGNVAGKVVNVGDKLVSAVEKSPFGVALSPLTSIARTGLGLANRVVGVANVAGNALAQGQQSVRNREGVGKIAGNALEKAKEIQMVAKGPKFA
jgi:hypothetical protein